MGIAEPSGVKTIGAEELTDEALLAQFTAQREEAAFAVLVQRYGGLVLGVCRRVLQHEQDAEDVFQAVFCVLARRAGAIRKREAVGAWLHGVAYRLARKARAQRGRRPVPVPNVPDIPAAEELPPWAWQELRPILDEEVNRLPDQYRQAFVLCYLQGRTNEQAAGLLGCPLGTVLSRLARARDRLRARLTRRGLALSAGALVGVLGSAAAATAVPPQLTQAALQSAITFRGGTTAGALPSSFLSPSVATLTEGFLRARARARLLQRAGGLLTVTLVGVVLLLLFRAAAAPAPSPRADHRRLQGTWRPAQVQYAGHVLPPQAIEDLRLTFAGDQLTLTSNLVNWTESFQLGATRTPGEITVHPKRGGPWPGIYEFDGDSLKLCVNYDGNERPTTFTSPPGRNVFYYQLVREATAP
jgi:RNA polymerase sigma factor (sigma-70 family)